MKLDYLKNREELFCRTLFWLSAFIIFLIAAKLIGFTVKTVMAHTTVKNAIARNTIDPKQTENSFVKPKEIADGLKKKNLFMPPPQCPVTQVTGILGNEALINGRWCKVGDMVQDAKVKSIEPTQIKIEWDGKERIFSPISANVPSAPPSSPQPPPSERRRKMPANMEKPSANNVAAAPVTGDDPLAWMGVTLSPKARERLLARWNSMSDEQKERWKERWNSMSAERKQRMIDAMEQN